MNERTLFPEWIGMNEDDFSNKIAEIAADANKFDNRLMILAEEREQLLQTSEHLRKIVDMQEPAPLTKEEAKLLLEWGKNFLKRMKFCFNMSFSPDARMHLSFCKVLERYRKKIKAIGNPMAILFVERRGRRYTIAVLPHIWQYNGQKAVQ